MAGYTDGTLSVLEWRWSKTVFQTEAHSPGPVTAIASTWNSVVSSGQYPSSPTPSTPPELAWEPLPSFDKGAAPATA